MLMVESEPETHRGRPSTSHLACVPVSSLHCFVTPDKYDKPVQSLKLNYSNSPKTNLLTNTYKE